MIEKIQKVQKIATQKDSTIHLNTSLPISIVVTEKIGFNRYMLKFANRSINTRSSKNLNVGSEYWGEIQESKENIIINGLCEKPKIKSSISGDGLWLIEKLIQQDDTAWFLQYLKQKLLNSSTKDEFDDFSNMLLAINQGIIHIPFVYNSIAGLFEFKKRYSAIEIYLVFSNFAPIVFTLNELDTTKIKTPFKKVANLLSSEFNCVCEIEQNLKPFWLENRNLVDYKG